MSEDTCEGCCGKIGKRERTVKFDGNIWHYKCLSPYGKSKVEEEGVIQDNQEGEGK